MTNKVRRCQLGLIVTTDPSSQQMTENASHTQNESDTQASQLQTSTDQALTIPLPPSKPASPALPASTSSSPKPTDPILPSTSAKSTSKPRARRSRPRRRQAGETDSEVEDASAGSDSSLTSLSESEASEDESDEEGQVVQKPKSPVKSAPADKPSASTFPDATSTVPVAWSDEKMDNAAEISFSDFNDPNKSTQPASAATTKGGPGANGEKGEPKVYTAEQTRRFEERKAKMKERQKAKRAELKESRRKDKEASTETGANPTTQPSAKKDVKGKGKMSQDPTPADADSAEHTTGVSDKTVEDASPSDPKSPSLSQSQRQRPNNREAYAEKIANDPKFTPRVGSFWTHDQRHYDSGAIGEGGYSGLRQMSEYWRGRGGPRGMPTRGGFRGRGRGGFGPFGPGPGGRGGFAGSPGNAGRELAPDLLADDEGGKKGMRTLEMDKLEAELDRAKEVREVEVVEETQEVEEAPEESEEIEPATSPAPVGTERTGNKKWGHEGYESMEAVEQFQAVRGRGRGRGRGRANFFRELSRRHPSAMEAHTPFSSRDALLPSTSIRASSISSDTAHYSERASCSTISDHCIRSSSAHCSFHTGFPATCPSILCT